MWITNVLFFKTYLNTYIQKCITHTHTYIHTYMNKKYIYMHIYNVVNRYIYLLRFKYNCLMFLIKYSVEIFHKNVMVISWSEFPFCWALSSHGYSLFLASCHSTCGMFPFPIIYPISLTKHSCVYIVDSNECLRRWSCWVVGGL